MCAIGHADDLGLAPTDTRSVAPSFLYSPVEVTTLIFDPCSRYSTTTHAWPKPLVRVAHIHPHYTRTLIEESGIDPHTPTTLHPELTWMRSEHRTSSVRPLTGNGSSKCHAP